MIFKKTTEYLFLATVFSLPSYLLKFDFFGIPTNASEIMAAVSIIAFWADRDFPKAALRKVSFEFILPIVLVLMGLFLSLANPGNFSTHGIGIIKSWFLIPMFFSFCVYGMISNGYAVRKIFLSLYFSVFSVSVSAIAYKLLEITTYDGRLSAFYLSPNHLSMFLAYGVLVFPYLLSSEKNGLPKKLLLLSAMPLLASLYWTFSYSVWLSVISAFLLTVFLRTYFFEKRWLMPAISITFILFVGLQLGSEKFSNILDSRSSLSSRMMIWKSSSKMVRDNPIAGIGPGNFQKKYLEYQKFYPPYLEWAVPQPHNIYLAFWLQAGFLGFFGFLLICIKSIALLLENKKSAISAVLLGIIFYILIHGLVDTPFWKNDFSYLFWLTVFISLTFAKKSQFQPINISVNPVKKD